MVDIIDFPSALKIIDRSEPLLVQNTLSGGVAMNGDEQIVSPLSGRWQWQISVPVRDKAEARSLRALKSKLKGRFNYARVRLCDRHRLSAREVGYVPEDGDDLFSDGASFSDGAGFAVGLVSSLVTVAGVAGGETLTISSDGIGDAMDAGVFFSVNGWLHQVEGFELDGDDYTLSIAPPLREDVALEDVARFDGEAIWALASDESGDVTLAAGLSGTAMLAFIEPVGRRLDAA